MEKWCPLIVCFCLGRCGMRGWIRSEILRRMHVWTRHLDDCWTLDFWGLQDHAEQLFYRTPPLWNVDVFEPSGKKDSPDLCVRTMPLGLQAKPGNGKAMQTLEDLVLNATHSVV